MTKRKRVCSAFG